jgi:DNA primase
MVRNPAVAQRCSSPGYAATARAVDAAARAATAPELAVLAPERLGDAKDPDAFVRQRGLDAFRELVASAGCAVTWRTLDQLEGVDPERGPDERKQALLRAARWLAMLPPRLALEQETALAAAAEQTGYSPEAVQRAFRARFWRDASIADARTSRHGRARMAVER